MSDLVALSDKAIELQDKRLKYLLSGRSIIDDRGSCRLKLGIQAGNNSLCFDPAARICLMLIGNQGIEKS